MIFQKIKRFYNLSPEDKKLFVEAWMTLGIIRVTSNTVPFRSQTRNSESTQKVDLKPLPEHKLTIALMVGRAIERASAYTLWESACLVQSLTAQRMLKKRGIPGAVCIGVRKEDSDNNALEAHAWSRCGDRIITGYAGHDKYQVISVLEWG